MRKQYLLILLAAAFIFIGSGCSESDTSMVIDFVNEWAKSRGILDENGNPTAKTIMYGATGMSTGDKVSDAAIDAGQVVKSLKDADEKAKTADEALGKNPPDYDTAMTSLTDAVDSRPKDWDLRSRKGVLLLETGKTADAGEYLVTKSDGCDPNKDLTQVQRERCFMQLEQEEKKMEEARKRAGVGGGMPTCDLLKTQADANGRLRLLAEDLNKDSLDVTYYRSAESVLRSKTDCK